MRKVKHEPEEEEKDFKSEYTFVVHPMHIDIAMFFLDLFQIAKCGLIVINRGWLFCMIGPISLLNVSAHLAQ